MSWAVSQSVGRVARNIPRFSSDRPGAQIAAGVPKLANFAAAWTTYKPAAEVAKSSSAFWRPASYPNLTWANPRTTQRKIRAGDTFGLYSPSAW